VGLARLDSMISTGLRRRFLLFALMMPLGAMSAPAVKEVVIPALHPSSREHAAYFPQLLRLALDRKSVV
jgi:hypothetical protein